ncbi:hypothetical protein ACFQZJ_06480 [Maribacter chungangensis]|uniref:Uncharacterized protein n=1 Tax=Maribacter chungangensis TaxID=1069117 RepID=A0ABW3B3D0_9FLAO
MKLFEELLENESDYVRTDDSVIIQFGAFAGLDEIHILDMRLFEELPAEIGRHDGHEVAMDDTHGTLYSYGKNAEALFKAMQPILNDFDFLDGATVHLSFLKEDKTVSEIDFEFLVGKPGSETRPKQ